MSYTEYDSYFIIILPEVNLRYTKSWKELRVLRPHGRIISLSVKWNVFSKVVTEGS